MNNHYLLFVSLLLINTVSLAKETAPTQPATSPTEQASSTATKPTATAAATAPEAAILDQGKQLYSAHCVRCHNTSVYTRKNRMIKSYESLKTQVQRCATNLDKPWFDDEVDAVAVYLNANYYLFKEKSPQ
ncbi:hypothetical protein THII_3657 [Thioploca ingrica]|uniref:Cytochrome c domain-containing protein n=1 Tax=Thioploca ingrica TaxID=40754 RepID=A0A090AK85_9GAMM|nr:hypothetical protein THII_3657 [Thioploca ingrica]